MQLMDFSFVNLLTLTLNTCVFDTFQISETYFLQLFELMKIAFHWVMRHTQINMF